MDIPPGTADEPSDAQLLRHSRNGDRHAFSELWRRHSPIAVAYARSLGAAPPDPEDVVSDAFLRILMLLRSGGGPEERFRPYLLTTVRNTWLTAVRRLPASTPWDEVDAPISDIGTVDLDRMVNTAALGEAFRSLPERWQHALWLSEVERLPAREIAAALDVRPNTAAALTYRARDGLRKAWIVAHLRRAPAGTDHQRVIELLGTYAHGDLAPRACRVVSDHLAGCGSCRSAAAEARHLARAVTLGPLLAGGAGLVVAPALFAEPAAAALTAATGAAGIASATSALPSLAAASETLTPALWASAASVVGAVVVSGTLLLSAPSPPEAVVDPATVVATSTPPTTRSLTDRAAPPASETLAPHGPESPSIPDDDQADDPVVETPGPEIADEVGAVDPSPIVHSTTETDETAGVDEAATDLGAPVTDEVIAPSPPEEADADPQAMITALPPLPRWGIDVTVSSDPVARGCLPVVTAALTGPAGSRAAIAIDSAAPPVVVTLDETGAWTGILPLPPASGRQTVSVHDVDASGATGGMVAQTVVRFPT
ncbi:sigma-70 family RNA polymerase sigma factor [Microbacterium sp. 179-I 3D3 NHS]|uniref:sigma-70 family RNA polymerase sigma factor n=1 Tax=Microbacterium sp. 179-I 3D3 NHS TaxID=3142382 RepID=UPI00399EED45